MANETKTVNKETGSNLTPIIIIGGILVATLVGIYMISQSGGEENAKSETNSQGNNSKVVNYDKAPAGATPAHIKGNANAAVVLEEFADFECPTCAVVHPKMKEITSEYGSRIKVVFRNYPLTQMHPKAYDAAVAAEAAGLQGKFWEMQNMLFTNQNTWKSSQTHKKLFEGYAKTLGLDLDKFTSDSLGLPTKTRVDADINRGRALDIRSTPSVLLNGKLIPFSQMEVASMRTLIDAELAKMNPSKEDSEKKDEPAKKDEKAEEKSDK